MKTELELLKERIKEIEGIQAHCNHDWETIKYDPEKKEITTEELVYLGPADSYYKEVGTGIFKEVDRWSRVCKKCGKKEYAYEMEEVVIRTEKRPKF